MKAAWMPFHAWLPSAMVAPTPVSSLLHAVAVVKAGVFGFVRIVCYVFGIDLVQALGMGLVLGAVAAFTMIAGSFFAIGEDNLKRRLAYSTISQLSYILFGVALLSPYGIKGAMIHIPFHGFMKITLFLCAGAIMVVTGKKQISQMSGVGQADAHYHDRFYHRGHRHVRRTACGRFYQQVVSLSGNHPSRVLDISGGDSHEFAVGRDLFFPGGENRLF